MKQPIRDLHEILFNIFANQTASDSQKEENVWAIYEGIHRFDPIGMSWSTVKANKEHECIRGHEIKAGDVYCKYNVGGFGSDWKFCAGCMAMLLHFHKVDEKPFYMFTHWNYEERRPVCVEEKK